MNDKIKQLDEELKNRHLADGDGTIDQETLRLMELRIRFAQAEQTEILNRRLSDLTQMIRTKF